MSTTDANKLPAELPGAEFAQTWRAVPKLHFAHHATLDSGRHLAMIIEPEWGRRWSRRLKWRIDDAINPYHCLDFCWYRDHRADYFRLGRWWVDTSLLRGEQRAYAWLDPSWVFCDVKNCFTSIDRARLTKPLARLDPSLPKAVEAHFRRFNFRGRGLPTGSAVACGLANAYLLSVDKDFVGSAIRYGDNYAVAPERLLELRNRLLNLGLRTDAERATFTNRKTTGSPSASCPTPPPAAEGPVEGFAHRGRRESTGTSTSIGPDAQASSLRFYMYSSTDTHIPTVSGTVKPLGNSSAPSWAEELLTT